jgi:hypothetical protein
MLLYLNVLYESVEFTTIHKNRNESLRFTVLKLVYELTLDSIRDVIRQNCKKQ